ncbi:MAG: alpha-amylase family glycosyl hydrolase [Clostridiales bacterium]|nr:alpha-amylase family glycosyl hydrolase [Clostridiales bacterium]
MKDYNKELVIIGENWNDSNPWLLGDQFDTVMNYGVAYRAVSFFAKSKFTCEEFTQKLVNLLMTYSDPINEQMFNFLDTHDTERFLYLANEDETCLKNALAFLYGYIGVPCIFYGTEIGLSGGMDPDSRKTFPWKEELWNHQLLSYIKRLISLRKAEVAIRKGTITFLSSAELFIMKRSYEGDNIYIYIYIIINTTNKKQTIPIQIQNEVSQELLSGKAANSMIPANSSYYLR